MSKDIRSFFTSVGSGKKKETKDVETKPEKTTKPQKKKRVAIISDSDDEDVPAPVKKKKSTDGTEKCSKYFKAAKKTVAEKPPVELKPVNAADIFGSATVKRSTAKTLKEQVIEAPAHKTKREKRVPSVTLDDGRDFDADFEATLSQLDEIEAKANRQFAKESQESCKAAESTKCNSPDSKVQPDKHSGATPTTPHDSSKLANGFHDEEGKSDDGSVDEKRKRNAAKTRKRDSCETSKKTERERKTKGKHSIDYVSNSEEDDGGSKRKVKKKEKEKKEVEEDGEEDEPHWKNDPAEKRRLSAMGYQRYLQREGPKHLGAKEVPEGSPGCLQGLVFVITGVLDSIERDAAAALVVECGGRVTASLSRNTSYLVIGEDAGPSKLEKAGKLNTPTINEDQLFDLIRTKSGLPSRASPQTDKSTREKPDSKPSKSTPQVDKKRTKLEEEKSDSKPNKSSSQIDRKKTKVEEEKSDSKPSKSTSQINKKSTKVEEEKLDSKPNKSTSQVDKKSTKAEEEKLYSEPTKSASQVAREKEAVKSPAAISPKTAATTAPSLLWVDKYRPTALKAIIGQQGDKSNVKKLLNWLGSWHRNQFGGKKLVRPSPWARDNDGAFFKAALLSGPPGVGKTTSAHLVSKELGYDIVEFNASDTRSKRLLHEEVSELLSNTSLNDYFKAAHGKTTSKHVLLMDEVDGMAGNEDRGGMQELIQLIKNSKVPILCMCNDVHHQKIRSLLGHCFDLRFQKPRVEQIRGAMQSVCFKEGVKIPPDVLTDMITGSNQDVRQVLHHLSLYSAVSGSETRSAAVSRHVKLGPWDVLKKVFSAEDHKKMSVNDKSDLFFHDYNISPLFVQENYLSVLPDAAGNNAYKRLDLIAQAANSICMGDTVERCIRSKNTWSLLPVQAMYASVIPGDLLAGHMTGQINFPSWLGKNSRRNKFDRLLQELHSHTRLSMSGNKRSLNLDYLPRLREAITRPLVQRGNEGIPASIEVMQAYHLLRTDIDSIVELSVWPGEADPLSKVESKVKAALTRTYNKDLVLPYSTVMTVSKKRSVALTAEGDDEDEEEEEDDADDLSADAMIKAKKRPAAKQEPTAGPSKAKRGRGRGKK